LKVAYPVNNGSNAERLEAIRGRFMGSLNRLEAGTASLRGASPAEKHRKLPDPPKLDLDLQRGGAQRDPRNSLLHDDPATAGTRPLETPIQM
jgi:hypothetical protein